jgi:hypothetical protein
MRKKLASLMLIFALTLTAFAGAGGFTPRPAEASLMKDAVLMVAYVAELAILWGELYAVKISRGHILDRMKHIHDRSLVEMRFDTTMYAHDHRALSTDARVNPPDSLSAVKHLYAELYDAGGISFGASAPNNMEIMKFTTGRAGAARPAGFPDDFRESGESLRKYARGLLDGNEEDTARMLIYQDHIWKMHEALLYGHKSDGKPDKYKGLPDLPGWYTDYLKDGSTPEEIGEVLRYFVNHAGFFDAKEKYDELMNTYGDRVFTSSFVDEFLGRAGPGDDELADLWTEEYKIMKDYHDQLPYKEADPDDFLDYAWDDDDKKPALPDEIPQGPGYRSTLQASGQISNFKNNIMSNVRVGIARRAEANAKFSLHETQMRADRHRAFERAVGTWTNSSTGTGY